MMMRWQVVLLAVLCIVGSAAVVYTRAREAEELPEPAGSWAPTLPRATLPPGPPPPPSIEELRAAHHSHPVGPKRIHDVAPSYPGPALASGIQGRVTLELQIDASGNVESVRVLKGIPALNDAARAAAATWRYEPARFGGKAVPVVIFENVDFVLPAP